MSDLTEKLITAAEVGDLAGVEDALAQGADVNERGPNSFALHCAAFGGFTPVVRRLLDAGARVDLSDAQGFQPLHLAASKGHLEVLQMVLDAGATANAQTPAGGTALHVAIASGFLKLIPALLAAGADVSVKDAEGRTPLMTAVGAHSLAGVRALLAAGADINTQDAKGWTPVWFAMAAIEPLIISRWESRGKMGSKTVTYSIDTGVLRYDDRVLPLDEQREVAALPWIHPSYPKFLEAIDVALELLNHKPELRPKQLKWTELHYAARIGEPRIIEPVLAAFDVLDDPTGEGARALHLAATSGRPDGLTLIIEACKEQINVGDDFGWTPLHYVCDKGGPPEVFELLAAAGADLAAKSTVARGPLQVGVLPIDVARHWRDDAAVELLEKISQRPAQEVH